MAIELHARWLRDGKTKAGEMLMANGDPLPVDLVPVCKEAKAVTGAEAMEELRRILRHARASRVEVVRFIDSRECWQSGNVSHGEELAQLLRSYQQVEADGYTPVEAIQAAAEAVPARRRSACSCSPPVIRKTRRDGVRRAASRACCIKGWTWPHITTRRACRCRRGFVALADRRW